MVKLCSKCKRELPLSAFYPRGDRGRYESRCKTCTASRQADDHRRWYEKNKARFASGALVRVTEKPCWRCKTTKRIAAFGISRSHHDGRNPSCKDCARAYSKLVGNPRKRIIDPAGRRASIYYNYRLRPHQLDRLLQQQAGSCAICRAAFTTTPYVDHCHTTGTVRGLLCRPCNALLAAFDKEGFLDRATAYLRSVDERCGWITSG